MFHACAPFAQLARVASSRPAPLCSSAAEIATAVRQQPQLACQRALPPTDRRRPYCAVAVAICGAGFVRLRRGRCAPKHVKSDATTVTLGVTASVTDKSCSVGEARVPSDEAALDPEAITVISVSAVMWLM